MLFNSLAYLLFLTVSTTVLFVLPKKIQWAWLLLCSSWFFYQLQPNYLVVLFSLIFLNYYFGLRIQRSGDRKQLTFNIALLCNLLVLAFFKYSGIIGPILDSFLSNGKDDLFRSILLPIGLSYFIFTSLSYLIEIKRGNIEAEMHLGVFASALMFFPKLLQGPIERPQKMIHQFSEAQRFDFDRMVDGLKIMVWGYFKKLVVADRLAIYVNAVYGNSDQHNGTTFAIATFFYAIQIYADFSGYTDIALGSAKFMGFDLTNNFRRPYFANSVKEFWNRWHITFSTWLRDYLFLPLAYFFSKRMKNEKYAGVVAEKWIFLFSSMITFAICGIWHGEGANFLFWGVLFGVYLSYSNWTAGINKNIRKALHIKKKSGLYNAYKIIITFLLVTFAFIFFRADNLQQAFQITGKIFTSHGELYIGDWQQFIFGIMGIVMLFSIEAYQEFSGIVLPFHSRYWMKEQFVYALLLIFILLTGVFDSGQFIYFKF